MNNHIANIMSLSLHPESKNKICEHIFFELNEQKFQMFFDGFENPKPSQSSEKGLHKLLTLTPIWERL